VTVIQLTLDGGSGSKVRSLRAYGVIMSNQNSPLTFGHPIRKLPRGLRNSKFVSPLTRLWGLKESETIFDLPLLNTYVKDARDSCRCGSCSGDMSRSDLCSVASFERLVVDLTHEIVSLSLFDTIEPIMVFMPSLHRRIEALSIQNGS
jgi:hypothetical protein